MAVSLSLGKLRGLQRLSSADGLLTMCAMDHRGSLAEAICANLTPEACAVAMTGFKLELCEALAPHASAVLLDPLYGAPSCLARGLVPRGAGLLVSLEETGYGGDPTARTTRLLPDWGVAKVKRMGADAAKLLLYYRPDLETLTLQQLELTREVAAQAEAADLPLLVEALSYPIGNEAGRAALFARHKTRLVVQTARDLTQLPLDVLKAEFPVDLRATTDEAALRRACAELDEAAAKPWVILSAGVDYDTFVREVTLACQAGASGYLAGRAIWQEAAGMEDGPARRRFLATTAAARLEELQGIAHRYARPWYKKLGLEPGALAQVPADWYQRYGAGP